MGLAMGDKNHGAWDSENRLSPKPRARKLLHDQCLVAAMHWTM